MKELRRSRTNRMVAGVCGGIGEYLNINPNVIRLVWVIVTVFTMGVGVLAYLLAWLVIPEEGTPAAGSAPAGTATSGTTAGAGTGTETTNTNQNR